RGAACINTAGEKVWPDEVEAALKNHADVFDTLVVGVPDERFGERVVALVEPRDGTTPDPETIIAHARRAVAGYKAPRTVITVDRIRRSPAGKPDYAWARAKAAAEAEAEALADQQ
ncbi:MAG TPA: acyl-CoA synthetase, partial [Acidimicrobiia bacterium]